MSQRAWGESARTTVVVAVPLVLVALIGGLVFGSADERVVTSFLITVTLAISIQVFSGLTGILSFGHLAFMGVGAYAGGLCAMSPATKELIAPALPAFMSQAEVGLPLALLIGFVSGGLVAGVIGVIIARMEETAMAMATVALLLVFMIVFDAADTVTGGAQGLYGIPQLTTVWIALIVAVGVIFIAQIVARSNLGMQLKATRSEPLAAKSLGVKLTRVRWIVWTLSGALIGLGGALWAMHVIAFSPGQFDFALTFTVLGGLVVGGISSVTGTVVGTAILTLLFELVRRIEQSMSVPGLTEIVIGVCILVILYYRPSGLFGLYEAPELWRGCRKET